MITRLVEHFERLNMEKLTEDKTEEKSRVQEDKLFSQGSEVTLEDQSEEKKQAVQLEEPTKDDKYEQVEKDEETDAPKEIRTKEETGEPEAKSKEKEITQEMPKVTELKTSIPQPAKFCEKTENRAGKTVKENKESHLCWYLIDNQGILTKNGTPVRKMIPIKSTKKEKAECVPDNAEFTMEVPPRPLKPFKIVDFESPQMEKKDEPKPEIIPYVRPPVPPPKQQTLSEQWQEYTKSRSTVPAPVSYSAQPLSQAQLQAQYQQQWMHYQAQVAIVQQYAQAQMSGNPQMYAGYPYDYSQYYQQDYNQSYVPPPQYPPLEQPYHKGKGQRGKNKPKRGGATHPQAPAKPPPPIKTCENCDKEFNNITVYEQHMAAHKKCDHCDFVAIPKVLAMHEQDEHGINLEIKYLLVNQGFQ
ncbi:hypothetical protein HDV01_002793 [Terramyces sp. JEL0728]|nr:hypothetical protein HDV01_002793 [Terramyces sp. JEL0728]